MPGTEHEAGGDADRLRMPPTIQALLAERLDRLSAPERMLLERASVIGKEFRRPLLRDELVTAVREVAGG